jgi:antitoxin VapB
MLQAQVMRQGDGQVIRLPAEYETSEDSFYVNRLGNTLFFFPKSDPWEQLKKSLSEFSDDFMADGRNQGEDQIRGGLDGTFV